MSAALASPPRAGAWRQVVRLTWSRYPILRRWWVGSAGFGVLFALLEVVVWPQRAEAKPLLLTLALGLTPLAWTGFVQCLLAQNQPTLARLVPGHLRTLRRAFLGTGAVACIAASAIGAAFDHALIAGAGSGLALLALTWIAQTPALSVIGWLGYAVYVRWPQARLGWSAVRDFGETQPAAAGVAVTALLLVAAIATSRALLHDGDAAHRRAYQARVLRQQAQRAGNDNGTNCAAGAGPFARLHSASMAPYRWLLARASTRRGGSVFARSLLGLGPQFHWSGQLGAVSVYGAVGILLVMLAWVLIVRPAPARISVFLPMVTGLGTYLMSNCLAARAVFYTTRREQALLMLLPGMPRAHALNRTLGARLMWQFGATWAAGALLCLGLVSQVADTAVWLGLLLAACLPCAALLLRDWSRLSAPGASRGALPVLGAMVLAALIAILYTAKHLPVWPFEVVFVVVAVVAIAWRWRLAMRAPAAFPAGRR